jgi:hypothetical protein
MLLVLGLALTVLVLRDIATGAATIFTGVVVRAAFRVEGGALLDFWDFLFAI